MLEIFLCEPPTDGNTYKRLLHTIEVREMCPERSAHGVRIVPGVHLADDDALILHVIDKLQFVLNVKRKQPKRTLRRVWNVKQSETLYTVQRRLVKFCVFPHLS